MNVVSSITVFHAKEAVKYYEEVFDAKVLGKIVMMEDMPGYEDTIYKGLVAHAHLKIGKTDIFINDQLGDYIQEMGRNIQMCLNVYNDESFDNIYQKVKESSTLERDIEIEYWGSKSFSIKDPHGIVWHIFRIYEEDKNE